VENGHTVPAIETLEKMARLLKCRLISSFMMAKSRPSCRVSWSDDLRRCLMGKFGQARRIPGQTQKMPEQGDEDRKLIMVMMQKMANGRNRRVSA